MHPVPDDLKAYFEVETEWTERWMAEKAARERKEDDEKYARPLTSRFDLSDVLPGVLDGTPHEWTKRDPAVRGPDGVVHNIHSWSHSVTACNIWWARSEHNYVRTMDVVDCIECLALG